MVLELITYLLLVHFAYIGRCGESDHRGYSPRSCIYRALSTMMRKEAKNRGANSTLLLSFCFPVLPTPLPVLVLSHYMDIRRQAYFYARAPVINHPSGIIIVAL